MRKPRKSGSKLDGYNKALNVDFLVYAAAFLFVLFGTVPLASAIPNITSLSVDRGPVGTAVTITGTGLGSSSTGTVTFNGTQATNFSTWTATEIQTAVPVDATTGDVVVTVSGDPSNGEPFDVTPLITN